MDAGNGFLNYLMIISRMNNMLAILKSKYGKIMMRYMVLLKLVIIFILQWYTKQVI